MQYNNSSKKNIPEEKILDKIVKYCTYRERCTYEVEEKLKSWTSTSTAIKSAIDFLIKERFLNEERYVKLFVKSKLNQNWGVRKITSHLKQKRVDSALIESAFADYTTDFHAEKLQTLAQKKWSSLKEVDIKKKTEKTIRYLISRGFELDSVFKEVKKLPQKPL
ncbi:MAG: RecX family transcriptional regulator [Bacteroidetes bacterium]|nr:RecX family transcriptional regulator [Bacteroidota bacterium]